jgi:hypothetical protein
MSSRTCFFLLGNLHDNRWILADGTFDFQSSNAVVAKNPLACVFLQSASFANPIKRAVVRVHRNALAALFVAPLLKARYEIKLGQRKSQRGS